MNDQIVSVNWIDNHQTAAEFRTGNGKRYVLPKRFLPPGLVATPAYSVRSARYVNEDHTAIVADTPEAGHVAVSAADTPALWGHIHSSGIKIAPYQTVADIPQSDTGTEILHTPVDPPEEQPSWLGGLLRRAEATQPEEEPALPELPVLDEAALVAEFANDQHVQTEQFVQALDDTTRRRAAKQRVAAAVREAAERVMIGQVRYEVAFEAKNGRIDSIAMLEDEARAKGLSVQVLSDQIVHERRGLERRMMLVYPVEERAYTDIDAATGDAIDAIATAAAGNILGDH